MANLKIIWTTGAPFSSDCREKIGYQINSENWNIYTGSYWVNQTAFVGEGNRPATAEEIAEHWKVLHTRWSPEPGDKVIITQDIRNWCNKRGTIVEADGSHYWVVRRDNDGHTCNFMKENQMILAPYEESVKSTSLESRHGFTIGDVVIPDCDNFKGRECIVRALSSSSVGVHCPSGAGLGGHTLYGQCPDNTGRWYIPSSLKLVSKEEPEIVSKPSTPSTPTIPIPKEGYVTVRIFTEEEFKSKDLWIVFGGQGYPKGWNNEGYMNRYLGTYILIRKSDFKADHSFNYEDWHFRVTDYQIIRESAEPKPEPKVETTSKPGMITVRFFTETEFKAKGKWYTPTNCPKGWIQAMNKYLGQTVDIQKSNIKSDGSFHYHGWLFGSNDYEVLTPGYESKASPKIETKVKAKAEPKEPEMKTKKFKVLDTVTYKSKSSCDGYRFGGNDHDGYVGTITSYLSYYSENGCYGIQVTSREGNYTMLESEFYEYDGTYPGAVTLGTSAGSDLRVISAGTANTTFLGTVGLQIVQTVPKPKDDLAKYDQAPVTLHKKPKTKLITVNTY
jgi:hypothetical protein